MKVLFDNEIIAFEVQYSKVKKISITMDSVGHIIVKAPKSTDEASIKKVVSQNGKAILKKLEEIAQIKERQKAKEYQGESKFLYLGKEYFLNQLIEVEGLADDQLQVKLQKFYIINLKKIINERVEIYKKELGVSPKSIEIVDSKTQWGSCTWDKRIDFNYRLAMAPIEVIDYVVVHELCHILHMNHDRSFWRKVGSIIPDYKDKQGYLAKYGGYMTL